MQVMHQMTLLQEENIALRNANHELSRRRYKKKRRLQEGGSMSVRDAQDLQAQNNIDLQLQADLMENGSRTNSGQQQRRWCRACGESGHNIRTCENRGEISEDSDST
jgi:hypothetical protein